MMTITKNQQIEFDVFPKDNKPNYSYLSTIKGDTTMETPSVHVVFSHQSVIIIFICVLMSLVASFSLGVEKGKLIGRSNMMAQKTQETTQKTTVPAMPIITLPIQAESIVPTTTPAMAAKEQPVASQGYVIQVASVKTKSSAKNLVEDLIKKGVPSFAKPSGKYIVVLAGNFAKKEEAQLSLNELKKTFNDCFIKKI